MNFLETIIAHKREEVGARKKQFLRSRLEDMPFYFSVRRSLRNSLEKHFSIIAEIKKASPSKHILREDFEPLDIAREYVQAGASALSVLTDEKYFQGRLEFIEQIRHVVSVPILRKDFIIDPYQLCESKAFGADAILLIAAVVPKQRLSDLLQEAHELGLECLVEVHNEDEIESLDFSLINLVGINNRDLTTFAVDLGTSFRLKKYIPSHVVTVSESGISTSGDIQNLIKHGIHAALIGEALMKAPSPGRMLAELVKCIDGPMP